MSADPERPHTSLLLPAMLIGLGVVGIAYGALQLGTWMATGVWLGGNPIRLLVLVAKNQLSLTETHLVALVLILLVLSVPVFFWARHRAKRRARAKTIDGKASHMGRGENLGHEQAVEKARQGRLTAHGVAPGLMFGRAVQGGRELWAAWREGLVVLMGPGGGKTSAFAVPMICEAPGIVVATSNKRDLPDAVCGLRKNKGQVWVFDPQQIAAYGEAPWFWNPLSYVTDEVRAAALAKLFCTTSRPLDAKLDAYFDSAAQTLIADLLLAAAVSGHSITDVYLWLSDSQDDSPVDHLRNAGYMLPAASLRGTYRLVDKQRMGVFGSAHTVMSFLNNRSAINWLQPNGTRRPEFRPEEFARSASDTLLSLSKEGSGTAGPITAAITVAVTEAIEEVAKHSPNGRLQVPALLMLDEAANTCRWHELPAQYSHYGSRGMMLVTILQNWAQGARAWTTAGMDQMWSAATIRIVGPGLADDSHLEKVTKLAGDRHVTYYATSNSHGRGSTVGSSTNQHKERTLSVADLAEMPHGRMLIIPTADRALLAATVPWWKRPIAPDIKASIRELEPSS